MTQKQLLAAVNRLEKHLHSTTEGYVGHEGGVHWKRAHRELEKLKNGLQPKPKVPALGPVIPGGKTILEQDLTHETGGVPHHPAFDDAVGRPGLNVLAPESLLVERVGRAARRDGSPNGKSIHALGASGIHYWFGHVEDPAPPGTRVGKGRKIGTISANHEAPHVHVGMDGRKLLGGADFEHHTNYTHGAPTVGAQLLKASV